MRGRSTSPGCQLRAVRSDTSRMRFGLCLGHMEDPVDRNFVRACRVGQPRSKRTPRLFRRRSALDHTPSGSCPVGHDSFDQLSSDGTFLGRTSLDRVSFRGLRIPRPRGWSRPCPLRAVSLGLLSLAFVVGLLFLPGCAATRPQTRSLVVTATAYNSLPGQTEGHPSIGAWGDFLDPAVPSIAVSPDLVRMGLGRGTRVRIEGFEREFFVLDKMPKKWKKRIDIHMGADRQAALQWGKREVEIRW